MTRSRVPVFGGPCNDPAADSGIAQPWATLKRNGKLSIRPLHGRRHRGSGYDGPSQTKCYELRVFTGLVEAIGHIQARSQRAKAQRLLVKSELGAWVVGESVAVNGVCLTVTEALSEGFFADVSAESLACSALGRLAVGSPVNLERALRLGDRLGGHWVSGHVDAVIRWIGSVETGESTCVSLELPARLAPYITEKGSVAIEGVSLTVNEVNNDRFTVMIIPHTRQLTTLGGARSGDGVNLEIDILARYVVHALKYSAYSETGQPRDADRETTLQRALIRAGFVHDSK